VKIQKHRIKATQLFLVATYFSGSSSVRFTEATFFSMAMSLRVEDRLQGAQNYPTWKERMTLVLEVNDVLNHTPVTDSCSNRSSRVGRLEEG
jgi:hypothetical protein